MQKQSGFLRIPLLKKKAIEENQKFDAELSMCLDLLPEYLGLILPEYLAKINGNWLFLALVFEKLIEIAKYYDWESIFRGSLKKIEKWECYNEYNKI